MVKWAIAQQTPALPPFGESLRRLAQLLHRPLSAANCMPPAEPTAASCRWSPVRSSLPPRLCTTPRMADSCAVSAIADSSRRLRRQSLVTSWPQADQRSGSALTCAGNRINVPTPA